MRHQLTIYRRSMAPERAVTLVEVLTVMLIMSIIGMVTISLMVSLFDSNIRAGQYLAQQTSIETFYGFLSSRLAVAQRGDVGLTYCRPLNGQQASNVCQSASQITPGNYRLCEDAAETAGNCEEIIDPLTISGDPVVFQSEGRCYRIFYVRDNPPSLPDAYYQSHKGSIQAVVKADCADLDPARGPNQTDNGNSSHDDPILDNPTANGVFTLADGINQTPPASANASAAPDPLFPFSFQGAGGNDTAGLEMPTSWTLTCAPASVNICSGSQDSQRSTPTTFYSDTDNLGNVHFITAVSYNEPTASTQTAKIQDRYYRQQFSLNQICAIEGLGDITVGDSAGGDLTGTYPNPQIANNAVGGPEIANGSVGASDLASPEAWRTVGAAGEPQFYGTWIAYGPEYPVRFYKDPYGVVHLSGLLKPSSGNAQVWTNPIFYLPEGYRPQKEQYPVAAAHNGSSYTFANLVILGNEYSNVAERGKISLAASSGISAGTGAYLSLDGITFRAG